MQLTTPGKAMGSTAQSGGLPRLVYIGDVPVESSYHGSALLYRLLQDYPPDKLLMIEAGEAASLPERRLPGRQYRECLRPGGRLQRTRLARWAASWFVTRMSAGYAPFRRASRGFDPQAVLTVAEGYAWLAAAAFAEQANLPLHLIVHDDWPSLTPVVPGLTPWLDRQFGRIYRQAASSPFMEEDYRGKYGVGGDVLYPGRAKYIPSYDGEPNTYTKGRGPLVAAFAGNLFFGYPQLILELAICLEKRGGRVLLFGPHSPEILATYGLNRSSIMPQGLVKSDELISRLRNEADVVFVPMAFDPRQHNMRVCFPSKLTDYTATGLPLLIWGPEDCSAVRWAHRYAPVAEVVTSNEHEELNAALNRLENAGHRKRLGLAAIEIGSRLFSHAVSVDILTRALQSHSSAGNNK
jgi:hypothetical protein